MKKRLREIRLNDGFLVPAGIFHGEEIFKITMDGISKTYFIEDNICDSCFTFDDLTLVLNRSKIDEEVIYSIKNFFGIYSVELIYENSPKETYYTTFDEEFASLLKISKTKEYIIININEKNKFTH